MILILPMSVFSLLSYICKEGEKQSFIQPSSICTPQGQVSPPVSQSLPPRIVLCFLSLCRYSRYSFIGILYPLLPYRYSLIGMLYPLLLYRYSLIGMLYPLLLYRYSRHSRVGVLYLVSLCLLEFAPTRGWSFSSYQYTDMYIQFSKLINIFLTINMRVF